MSNVRMVRVELRGLTFLERVWNEGDEVPLSDLSEYLQEQVKAGKHPHLALVETEKAASKKTPGAKKAT